jgi:hypothetical protein
MIHARAVRPRGGVVTQQTANLRTPVRFRAWPPIKFYRIDRHLVGVRACSARRPFRQAIPTKAPARSSLASVGRRHLRVDADHLPGLMGRSARRLVDPSAPLRPSRSCRLCGSSRNSRVGQAGVLANAASQVSQAVLGVRLARAGSVGLILHDGAGRN